MKKILLILIVIATYSFGGDPTYIIKNGIVTGIANTGGNEELFVVWVEGGTGPCSVTNGKAQINFPRSASSSDEIYKRAYATALTALSNSMPVTIYNYLNDDCKNAAYIAIGKP